MTVYGYTTRKPEVDYCATVRLSDGCSKFEYFRTNLGPRVAYGMLAKHYADVPGAKFELRYGDRLTDYDKEGIAQGNPGLFVNVWAGYGEMRVF